eukprot:Awhi_evm1s1227
MKLYSGISGIFFLGTVANSQCAPKVGYEAYAAYCGSGTEQGCSAFAAFCSWAAAAASQTAEPQPQPAGQATCEVLAGQEVFSVYCDTYKNDQSGCNAVAAFCRWTFGEGGNDSADDVQKDIVLPPINTASAAGIIPNLDYCAEQEASYVITANEIIILRADGSTTACVNPGYSNLRGGDIDSQGNLYVIDGQSNKIYKVSPDCSVSNEIASSTQYSFLISPVSVTVKETQDGTVHLVVAMQQPDPMWATTATPNESAKAQVYDFTLNGGSISGTSIMPSDQGTVTDVYYDTFSNYFYGIINNKFTTKYSESDSKWHVLPEITSIVDMRQVSAHNRCSGKTNGTSYITADDNNAIYGCKNMEDPATCSQICPSGIMNPYGLAIGVDCSVYGGSTGSYEVYKFDSLYCGVSRVVLQTNAPVYDIVTFKDTTVEEECEPWKPFKCDGVCKVKELNCIEDHTCGAGFRRTDATDCTGLYNTDCSVCCEPKPCSDHSCDEPGSIRTGEPTCLVDDQGQECGNCCVFEQCKDEPECLPGFKDSNDQYCSSDDCSNCCELMYCVNETTCEEPGLIESGEVECTTDTCDNCCIQLTCAAITCGNGENDSGDENCFEDDCSNCCTVCYDGELSGQETCEYLESIDKYIVPEGDAQGIPNTGNSEYDYLKPELICDSNTCQIAACPQSQTWQRVCAVSDPGQLVGEETRAWTLQIPGFDIGFAGGVISAVDLFARETLRGEISATDIRPGNPGTDNQALGMYGAEATISFTGFSADPFTIIPYKENEISIPPGQTVVFNDETTGESRYYVTATKDVTIPASEFDKLYVEYFPIQVDGKGTSSIAGSFIDTTFITVLDTEILVRFSYDWCPTPRALKNGQITAPVGSNCQSDGPTTEDWKTPLCGDGIINVEGEICDGKAGSNETFYCGTSCTLIENACGDGIVWGNEPCDFGNGKDSFRDESSSPRRCRKLDEPNPCTVEDTVCGDGIFTDNEECEYVPNELGTLPADSEGYYCDEKCKLTPIRDCKATAYKVCNCELLYYSTTYQQTGSKSIGGKDCVDNVGRTLSFLRLMAEVENDGPCVCECGNNLVDGQDGEQCDDDDGFYVIDSKTVCEECQKVDSRCGDRRVDPIRGEECDDIYSQGGSITPDQKWCDNKCKLRQATGCVYGDPIWTSCSCTIANPFNGTQTETIEKSQDAVPADYLGGCNPKEVNRYDCDCEQCVGKWRDEMKDGLPYCEHQNDGTCMRVQKFIRKSAYSAGNICLEEGGTEYFRRNSKRRVVSTECQTNGACVGCQETLNNVKCSKECGAGGVQVGFYEIQVEPGYASTFGGNGNALKCHYGNGQSGTYQEAWEELWNPALGAEGQCDGTKQFVQFERTCSYTVPRRGMIIPYENVNVNRFSRPNIVNPGGLEEGQLTNDLLGVKYEVKASAEGQVTGINNAPTEHDYTVTFEGYAVVTDKGNGFEAASILFPLETRSLGILGQGEEGTAEFTYPETSALVIRTENLDYYQGNEPMEHQIKSLSVGKALGGPNSRSIVVSCSIDAPNYDNGIAQCTQDVPTDGNFF